MIATKLVVQALAGIAVVGGIVGGSYAMVNNSKDYLLVVSVSEVPTDKPSVELFIPVAKTKNTDAPAQEATVVVTPKTEKHYTCNNLTKQKDENCELYSIDFDTTKKTIYSKNLKINSEKLVKEKAKLVDKAFFLLKVSPSLFANWSFDGKENIKLMSKEIVPKSHATLKVHAKVNSNSLIGKTDFAIVKAANGTTALTTSTTDKTYKCKFKVNPDVVATENCSIFAVTNQTLTTDQTLEDLGLSSFALPSTVSATTITSDKHYLIKWNEKSIKDLTTNNSIIFVEDITEPTKKAELQIQSPVLGSFFAGKQEVIIINK